MLAEQLPIAVQGVIGKLRHQAVHLGPADPEKARGLDKAVPARWHPKTVMVVEAQRRRTARAESGSGRELALPVKSLWFGRTEIHALRRKAVGRLGNEMADALDNAAPAFRQLVQVKGSVGDFIHASTTSRSGLSAAMQDQTADNNLCETEASITIFQLKFPPLWIFHKFISR